jgi:hypothetical protein
MPNSLPDKIEYLFSILLTPMTVFKPTKLAIFCLFSLLIASQATPGNICQKLHIGSKLGSKDTISDIVKDGIPSPRWNPLSPVTNIVGPYKALEHFYLVDVDFKLKNEDLTLTVDQPDHVKSELFLKKETKGFYLIEVNYRCDSYGGVLILYTLNINIPECGVATITWRKLCGNPYTERAGFTVEMSYAGYNQVIVRNGRVIEAHIFDRDVDNYAMMIPEEANLITFSMYMDNKDAAASNQTVTKVFSPIPMSLEKKDILEVYVGKVNIDSDEFLVNASVSGDMTEKGSFVTNTSRTNTALHLDCNGWEGVSTVEFDIPIYHFKEISLFFLKRCAGSDPHAKSGFIATVLTYTIYIFIALMIYSTYLNTKEQGYFSLDAIPYYTPASQFVKGIGNGASSKPPTASKGYSYHQADNHGVELENTSRKLEVDDDADFRVDGGASETGGPKYGTF